MKKSTADKNVKQFLGMPMRWEPKNLFKNIWNENDDRVFPPKHFGIGWSLNLHALSREVGLIKAKKSGKQ
jgi:hypothetical protein